MLRPAGLVLLALTLTATAAVHAQSADEVVALNLKSKGGAKWQEMSSVKMSGRMSSQGMQLPMVVYARRPNHTRQELEVKGAKLVQAFDGTTGWMINPLVGSDTPQELPAPLVQMMRNTADFDGPLINYKQKGHAVELVGRDTLGDTAVHHLKITLKSGDVQHTYLDATTGVELRKTQEVDLGTGEQQTLETRMSDYRPVDGVMVAHTITQSMNGKPVAEMAIERVEFNPADMQDALFRMPSQ